MGKWIHRIGKYYSSIFIDCIGLMIFSGLLSVAFQESGWLPNKEIYGISQLVYQTVLPVCISYIGGRKISGHTGGIMAVLAVVGVLYGSDSVGVLAGMLAAPLGGFSWKYAESYVLAHGGSSMQMLIKNILMGLLGCLYAVAGYYGAAPFLSFLGTGLSGLLQVLADHHASGLFCIFIEPLKVLFLNNIVNHGIFDPLGVQQLQESGQSVLFLLETNPGPGVGILTAFYFMQRENRDKYGAMILTVAAGGIHEVYFPVVLAHISMLIPLIAGSVAGALWFNLMKAGLGAPVSPGSVISILLLADKGNILKIALGILVSALVAWAGAMVILALECGAADTGFHDSLQGTGAGETRTERVGAGEAKMEKARIEKAGTEETKAAKEANAVEKNVAKAAKETIAAAEEGVPEIAKETRASEEEDVPEAAKEIRASEEKCVPEAAKETIASEEECMAETAKGVNATEGAGVTEAAEGAKAAAIQQAPVRHVAFVCDAGIGSSAMGAALFRRKLAEMGVTDVQVQAYASNAVPGDADLIVCQADFADLMMRDMVETQIAAVGSLMDTAELGKLAEMVAARNG